mmetsp:Transcript_23318/g.79589  ORF Transcript_23318/g.79589 Transcript_23318/m.79589 type:complete len:231 (+) Transcript_23318:1146-1838(+)
MPSLDLFDSMASKTSATSTSEFRSVKCTAPFFTDSRGVAFNSTVPNSPTFSKSAPGSSSKARLYSATNFDFKCCGVPRATSSPRAMTPHLVHRASASSMECDVKHAARSAMVARSTSHRLRRETGSNPAEGSSKSTTLGPPIKATAVHSLRFWPPDNCPASLVFVTAVSRCICDKTVATTSSSRCGSTSRKAAKSWQCSRAVRRSYRASCWVTTPRCLVARSKSSSTEDA